MYMNGDATFYYIPQIICFLSSTNVLHVKFITYLGPLKITIPKLLFKSVFQSATNTVAKNYHPKTIV